MSGDERVIAAARRAHAVLEEIQWNGYSFIGLAPCPMCGSERVHDADCELNLALDELDEALSASPLPSAV